MKEHPENTNTDSDYGEIYVYTEEEDSAPEPLDNSGPNYSQAEYEEETGHHEPGKPLKKTAPILNMLKIMVNPVEGWKNVRRIKDNPESIMRGCFLPAIALLFLSRFAKLLYGTDSALTTLTVEAASSAMAMFFSYFCLVICARHFSPGYFGNPVSSAFGKSFLLYSLSSLCLFFALPEVLPMLWAILIFLPLWTAYCVFKGARFFRFPRQKESVCTFVLAVAIIAMPVFLNWIMIKIL